jgi:hypothetical protein
MYTMLVFFGLSIIPTYKLTLRWKTKKLACLAALIGVVVSIVGTPTASVLIGFVYDQEIVETLMSGLATSMLSIVVSPLAAYTGWRKANTVHKMLVSKCPSLQRHLSLPNIPS